MTKAVIFDLDGTLYDYETCHQKAMCQLIDKFYTKYMITDNQFLLLFERARKDVKKRLGNVAAAHNRLLYIQGVLEQINQFHAKDALECYHCYWNTFLDVLELYQEVIPIMQWLKGLGIKIAVCTDLTARIQFEKIVESGLDDYIDIIVTSEEAGAEKPDEKMFELALNKLGVCHEEAIMFGDNYKKDIQGAKRLFIHSIWMDSQNYRNSFNQLRQAVICSRKPGRGTNEAVNHHTML